MATAPGITLLLLSLLVVVPPPWSNFAYAQNNGDGSSGNSAPPPPNFNPRFNPSMAILIVILITAFFFMGFFSIYLRNCGSSAGDGGSTGRVPFGAVGSAARSRRAANRGLDPSVIATFPTLVYSDVKEHKLGKGSLECAVCLSEFDNEEELRLLPNCSHAFHTDCIDTWLVSHTTCPVCRDNLAAAVPVAAVSADAAEATAARSDGAETAADAEQATPPPVVAEGSVGSRSRHDQERPADHVVVDIPTLHAPDDESITAPLSPHLSASTSVKRSGSVRGGTGGSVRGGSVRGGAGAGGLLRSWRSRSARPAVWAEDDRERFTLRLPESVRREVMSGKLNRSRSLASFPVVVPPPAVTAPAVSISEGGSRRGYRTGAGGEGSSRGWRSARFGWATKSDRWASLARQLSSRFGLGGNGNSNGGGDTTEGSTAPKKADAGEGSVSNRGKAAGNREKKGAGVGKTDASADGRGGADESTLPFARV